LATVADASYGSPVRRLTAATDDLEPILRAGLQVESPDGALVLLYEDSRSNPFAKGMSTYRRIDGRRAPAPAGFRAGMPHWRPLGPPALVFFRGSGDYYPNASAELVAWDVASGAATVLSPPTGESDTRQGATGGVGQTLFAALPGAYSRHWQTTYPSRNGSRYAYWSVRQSVRGVALLDVSSSPPTAVGILTSWPAAWGPVTGARVTPSGSAVLVSFAVAGVYVYDAAMTACRRVMATRLLTDDVADVMVAAGSGHDTLVAVVDDAGVEDSGWVVAVDLVTFVRAPLFRVPRDGGPDGGPRVAVSGQAYDRPGWVVLSGDTCAAGAAGDWICGKVVALEVSTRRVVPLATTHSCVDGGVRSRNSGAPATPNRDASRVYYTSGSEVCRGTMELYELQTVGRLEGGGAGAPPLRPPPLPVAVAPAATEAGGASASLPNTGLNVGIAI